jgi:hypothetical protein
MPGIFRSYATGDDEPYARNVYERLRAEGYDVCFDREHMPSRALAVPMLGGLHHQYIRA